MVNYASDACIPIVMSAPDPRSQIAQLEIADSPLEVTWRDNHYSRYPDTWLLETCNHAQFDTPDSQLPR